MLTLEAGSFERVRALRAPGEFSALAGIEAVVLGSFAASAGAGPCVTCRWASGDGRVFECELRARETEGEGCAAWEREAGAD